MERRTRRQITIFGPAFRSQIKPGVTYPGKEATFLEFGSMYEEGCGQFPVAIVEFHDGTVGFIELEKIRFVHPSIEQLEKHNERTD